MTVAINQLPDRQLAVLGAAYVAAGREKRRQLLAGAVVLAACIGLAAYVGEVDMVKLPLTLAGSFPIFPASSNSTTASMFSPTRWNGCGVSANGAA